MPIKQSAIRDLRVSRKQAEKNVHIREQLRFLVRRCRHQFSLADKTAAQAAVATAIAAFDRAVRSGVVKARNAARHKSRLMLKLNQLGGPK